MKLIERKPIQNGYIVYYQNPNDSAESFKEFDNFYAARNFAMKTKRNFKRFIFMNQGKINDCFTSLKQLHKYFMIVWQLDNQEFINLTWQPSKQ